MNIYWETTHYVDIEIRVSPGHRGGWRVLFALNSKTDEDKVF